MMSAPHVDETLATMELLQEVLQHLPPADLIRSRQVSKWWKAAVDSPSAGMKVALWLTSNSEVLDTCTKDKFKGARAAM
jgi:hypothetical protein